MLRTGKCDGDSDAGVYQPAADAVGTESLAVRNWEEFDTHCRGTDLPGRLGNAGAWHGAGVADWPHVRPRRGRCGVERLVQWGIRARRRQGARSNLRSSTSPGVLLTGGVMMMRKPCSRRIATSSAVAPVAQGTPNSLQAARTRSRFSCTAGWLASPRNPIDTDMSPGPAQMAPMPLT